MVIRWNEDLIVEKAGDDVEELGTKAVDAENDDGGMAVTIQATNDEDVDQKDGGGDPPKRKNIDKEVTRPRSWWTRYCRPAEVEKRKFRRYIPYRNWCGKYVEATTRHQF